MLTITVPMTESYNSKTREFLIVDSVKLELEHSLVSLSKWESKFEKPFLTKDSKTAEELFGYIEAMILTEDVPDGVLQKLTQENIAEINQYIEAKMTATWFSTDPNAKPSRETITSELIYYWMITHNIPFDCEKWHIKRLFTLIEVCNRKNAAPQKGMSKAASAKQRSDLNAQRKAQYGIPG